MKGCWKVVLADGTLVESGLRTKRAAAALAEEINARGSLDAGISSFPREERL